MKKKINEAMYNSPFSMVTAQLRNIQAGQTGNVNVYGYNNYDFEFDAQALEGNAYNIRMSYPQVGNPQTVAGGNAVQAMKSMCDAYIQKTSPQSYQNLRQSYAEGKTPKAITESRISQIVKESIHKVLKEENENAKDSEWILWACRLCILNNRPIYDLYNSLENSVAKLRKRGVEPSLEKLTNCSTMKKLVSMAFHDNDINVRAHKQEFFQVCYNTAKEIIENN